MTDAPSRPATDPAQLETVTGATGRLGASISLESIGKSYGGTPVLDDVSVTFEPGTIHGIVGENGAGKSTLMKVLSGVVQPDRGAVVIDGKRTTFKDPDAALQAGIAIISQELAIVRSLTVMQNVFLGHCGHRFGWRTPARDRQRFEDLRRTAGFKLDPHMPAEELPLAAQQQVEVMRALSRSPRLVIMDEPTAVLTDQETRALLRLMRRLADQGTTVVLISHFLEEVLDTCDRITVLRDGQHVSTGPCHSHTTTSLIEAMVGESVDVMFPELPSVADNEDVVLRTLGLSRSTAVHDIDLHIRRGEILGIAGLVGSGRTEVARLIFGADRADSGTITVAGKTRRRWTTRSAMRAGVALVPESRKDEGLLLGRSIQDNLALANNERVSRWGILRRGSARKLSAEVCERLDVRAANTSGAVWTLSGGNQQKVLLGRWITRSPALLIVDEPTRGVDISAKAAIHRLIVDLARNGTAILLISSETEEVLGLSHRILVMRHGRISARLDAATATTADVLTAAFADTKETAA